MDVTDVKRLGGTPLNIVGACSRPSDAPPFATVPPNRCPTPDPRGSYCPIPSRRLYLLETTEARLHRRGIESVFAGSFVVLEAGVGCTDSTVHGNHQAVVC